MELILEPKPYLLYETVGMIFSYVNDISILSARDRLNRDHKISNDDVWYRRLTRLQEIMEACCHDLEREDEAVQHFFRQISTGCSSDYTYLAGVITTSFMQFQKHDLEGEIQALKDNWRCLQTEGYKLSELGACGLNVIRMGSGEEQQNLSQQVYALKYPAELRLEIINTLSNYDAELDRLADLLRPYASRLEAHLHEEPWLMDTTVAYWSKLFETSTPAEFVNSKNIDDTVVSASNIQRVCFLLMNCAQIFYDITDDKNEPDNGLFVLGCAIRAESVSRHSGRNRDWILSTLRSLSDKNKFELIRRLSKEQSYCQKLAEELDCHPGNVSRNLITLWKEGFLIRKEGESRIYYETDADRIISFLREVQEWLTGKVPYV